MLRFRFQLRFRNLTLIRLISATPFFIEIQEGPIISPFRSVYFCGLTWLHKKNESLQKATIKPVDPRMSKVARLFPISC